MEDNSVDSSQVFHPLGIPPGVRVMLVDDDCTYHTLVKKLLTTLRYRVVKLPWEDPWYSSNIFTAFLPLMSVFRKGFSMVKTFASADPAWMDLHKRNAKVDVFMIDVHMPGGYGFELIDKIKREWSDLPVIMCSKYVDTEICMRLTERKGCFYLPKPATVESLMNLWQLVDWSKKQRETEASGEIIEDTPDEGSETGVLEGEMETDKKDEEGSGDEQKDESTRGKKAHFDWKAPIQARFYRAIDQLGINRAIPTAILERMDVPGLTRQNVASRLQKYRLFLKKVNKAIFEYTTVYFPPPPDIPIGFNSQEETPVPFGTSQMNTDSGTQIPEMNAMIGSSSLGGVSNHYNSYPGIQNADSELWSGVNNNTSVPISDASVDNGYNTVYDFGPDPYTWSSIYNSNAPSMMTASSVLGEGCSNLQSSGTGFQATHDTEFPFGVSDISAVPFSGASVGIDTMLPEPGCYTLETTDVQPVNLPNSSTFQPNAVPELIDDDVVAKLESLMNSEDLLDFLS